MRSWHKTVAEQLGIPEGRGFFPNVIALRFSQVVENRAVEVSHNTLYYDIILDYTILYYTILYKSFQTSTYTNVYIYISELSK